MSSVALLNSIQLSISRNGLFGTLQYMVQYLRFKIFGREILNLSSNETISRVRLRPGTSDFSVFRQIFMDGEYDIQSLGQPSIIADIGANIGLASVYFHNRFPSSRIFAIEPDESNFGMLVKNTEGSASIIPLKLAIWGKVSDLEILDQGHDKWGLQVREAQADSSTLVQGIDITTFMKGYALNQIDLLKIDVEGAERDIFFGDYASWLPKVKVLVIELHDHLVPGCTEAFEKAVRTINHKMSRSGENIIIYNLDLIENVRN